MRHKKLHKRGYLIGILVFCGIAIILNIIRANKTYALDPYSISANDVSVTKYATYISISVTASNIHDIYGYSDFRTDFSRRSGIQGIDTSRSYYATCNSTIRICTATITIPSSGLKAGNYELYILGWDGKTSNYSTSWDTDDLVKITVTDPDPPPPGKPKHIFSIYKKSPFPVGSNIQLIKKNGEALSFIPGHINLSDAVEGDIYTVKPTGSVPTWVVESGDCTLGNDDENNKTATIGIQDCYMAATYPDYVPPKPPIQCSVALNIIGEQHNLILNNDDGAYYPMNGNENKFNIEVKKGADFIWKSELKYTLMDYKLAFQNKISRDGQIKNHSVRIPLIDNAPDADNKIELITDETYSLAIYNNNISSSKPFAAKMVNNECAIEFFSDQNIFNPNRTNKGRLIIDTGDNFSSNNINKNFLKSIKIKKTNGELVGNAYENFGLSIINSSNNNIIDAGNYDIFYQPNSSTNRKLGTANIKSDFVQYIKIYPAKLNNRDASVSDGVFWFDNVDHISSSVPIVSYIKKCLLGDRARATLSDQSSNFSEKINLVSILFRYYGLKTGVYSLHMDDQIFDNQQFQFDPLTIVPNASTIVQFKGNICQ